MNAIRHALNSGREIDRSFVEGLERSTGYPGGAFSPQTRIVRKARRLQSLERQRGKRLADMQRHGRRIEQYSKRVRAFDQEMGKRLVTTNGQAAVRKRLIASIRSSERKIAGDRTAANRLLERIETCASNIDRLHANALNH